MPQLGHNYYLTTLKLLYLSTFIQFGHRNALQTE